MNKARILQFSSILAVVAFTPISFSAINPFNTGFGQQQHEFMAKLTGQDEVPSKNTKASGTFVIQLTADGKLSNYVLNLTNTENVTLVHIHLGEKGINGPILVTLYKNANPRGLIDGTLSEAKIYGYQFEGPLAGKYISDLINLINEGKIYINVHTKQNPQGEIRGQLSTVTSPIGHVMHK